MGIPLAADGPEADDDPERHVLPQPDGRQSPNLLGGNAPDPYYYGRHSEPSQYDDAASFMRTKPEETFVFEDSLYALKTAAAAGYIAVGVFDSEGESDQDIKKLKEA